VRRSNADNKTCLAFSRYAWTQNGTITNVTEIAFAATPLVTIKNGRHCHH